MTGCTATGRANQARRARTATLLTLLGLVLAGCQSAAPAQPAGQPAGPSATAASAPATGTSAPAAAAALTGRQITTYRGADRQRLLEDGARREGKLTWYTTLIVDQVVRPLKDAFEKKYPFVTIEYFRGDPDPVTQRVISEYQAKRYDADIVDGSTPPAVIEAAGYLGKYDSPVLDVYPPELKDKHGTWATTNVSFITSGFNSKLVQRSDLPKTYDDLLNPKWKDKFIWGVSTGSGGPLFVGNVLRTMGEAKGMEYLRKLSQQNLRNINASARAVLDMVIAGDAPIALQVFNHHTVISAKAGAPSDWFVVEAATGLPETIGLLGESPHPYAATLFMDFVLSEEGQTVLRDAEYLPANPKVAPLTPGLRPQEGGFKANFVDPEEGLTLRPAWQKVFQEIFTR